MRAVIYCRVSTKEQAQNLSLPTQLAACEAYCRREDVEVAQVFEDAGESAKTTDRPEFQRLLGYCRANKGRVQFVVVYNLTRFSRNAHDHAVIRALLLRLGVTLRSVSEPISDDPVGKLTENMLAAIGQFDNDQKAQRTKVGMRAALAKGRWTWLAPLGYTNGNAKIGEPSLIADVERVPLIARAFEMIASGHYSPADVLKTVTNLGLRTRKGVPLTPQTFGTLIRRPIYAGIIDAPGFALSGIRGDFEPLVSEAIFQRAQGALRRQHGPTPRRLDSPDFPLRRFVVCDRCGTPLTGSAPKGRTKTYPYYHCRKCRGVSIRREGLHGQFVELLQGLQPKPEYLALFRAIVLDVWKARVAEAGALRAAVEARLADLRRREMLLEEAYLYGKKIDAVTYERQRDTLREQIALAEIDLGDARHEELDVEGLLTNAARLWIEATAEQKPRLQQALFPQGLRLKDKMIGTAATCIAFTQLRALDGENSEVASPTRIFIKDEPRRVGGPLRRAA
jgi:DNA invertase Pin-like site-specific DNA recombinase